MTKNKILVVDDEPDLVATIETRLKENGYDVITAGDGEEGLEKAKRYKPDLIILDILMPKMDGILVGTVLKEDKVTRDIPIIFLTCLAEKDEVKDAQYVIGGNLFLAKPFDGKELLLLINKVLNK